MSIDFRRGKVNHTPRWRKLMNRKGFFLALEGLDGSGKSTMAKELGNILQAKGFPVLTTSEPSQSKYGQWAVYYLDCLKIHGELPDDIDLVEIFIKDREVHLQDVILPALERNEIVICDRYILSTMAYQASNVDPMRKILARQKHFPPPDVMLFLQITAREAMRRILWRKAMATTTNGYFEVLDKLERIENNYKQAISLYRKFLAKKYPSEQPMNQRMVILNDQLDVHIVLEHCLKHVLPRKGFYV